MLTRVKGSIWKPGDNPHTHPESDVDGLETKLAALTQKDAAIEAEVGRKANAHGHPYRPNSWKPSWGDVTDKPSLALSTHSHDGRYYTEAESNSRFLGKTAKAADADKLDGISSGGFLRSDSPDNINCDLEFQDNRKLKFGNDSDFQIWNDGSNQYMRNYKHGAVLYIQGESASGSNKTMIMADPDNHIRLYYAGVEKIKTESGGVKVTGTLSATTDVEITSDRRVKTNIAPIPKALDKVDQLSGNTYDRTDIEAHQAGLIAQELQAVLPESVSEDENGQLSVRYSGVVALLVEAVKELRAEVKALKHAKKGVCHGAS